MKDFPEEGAPTPQGLGGAPTYEFAKFPQKLHEIERIWTPGGGTSLTPPLDQPLPCTVYYSIFWQFLQSDWLITR